MQRKWKRRWQRLTKVILSPVAAGLLLISAYSPVLANPAGGTVVSGSAAITASGSTMTVSQTTNKAIINWQSFSIGKGETVNFVQPSSSAVALNRVIGNDASSIYGSLNANGKVYLVNPNGILFAPGASVNVGGLVASTLNISDSDFLNGSYSFSTNGSAGSVVNQGTITAANEAVLIGPKVANEGTVAAKVAGLGAGNKVSLDFSGDSLLTVTVDTGAVGGSAANTGTITASGGLVVMSAGTKDALLGTVVNNSGVIRAQSVTNAGGVIRLEGNTAINSGTLDAACKAGGQTGGTVKVLGDTVTLVSGSSIDVSGDAGGGTALIGGAYQGGSGEYAATATTVERGAVIQADAITNGNGGTVVVWSEGATTFAGAITARGGSVSGNGGTVETSGHTLAVSGTVNASATNGSKGSWLLDPNNITIQASGANTNVDAGYISTDDSAVVTTGSLETALNGGTDVTITTTSAGSNSQDGNITVADAITWGTTNTLTLSAANNIYLNSAITAATGGLTLKANTSGNGNGTTTGIITPVAGSSISVGTFTLQSGTWKEISSNLSSFYAKDFRIGGGTFLRVKGGAGTSASPYQIADVYGLQGIGSNSMLGNSYTLANDIDASGTQYWNYDSGTGTYLGFAPIINGSTIFTGNFDGGGHTITGLTINRPSTNCVGLFGYASGGTLRNVGLLSGSVIGASAVGGLVGVTSTGSVTNCYSTGAVSGSDYVGGLVGSNFSSSITNCYSTGVVSGNYNIGGLVGYIGDGSIRNCYSTGAVSGSHDVGGLLGYIYSGSITNCYSTGAVSGSHDVGGLLGYNYWFGSITNCYWDVDTSGLTYSSGGTGLSTAQMKQLANFAGWDIAIEGGSSSVWRMYEGYSYPLLSSFLTPLTVTINANGRTYNGNTYTGATCSYSVTPDSALLQGTLTYTYGGSAIAPKNAGTYAVSGMGLYSASQQGYDISYAAGTLTIAKADLTVTASNQAKTYGKNLSLGTTAFNVSGLVTGDSVNSVVLTSSGADAAAGTGQYAITASGAGGSGLDNYNITYHDGILMVSKTPWQFAGYTGAVIHADYTAAGLLGPFRRYCQPPGLGSANGYLTGCSGDMVPLSIILPGVNTAGYVPLRVLNSFDKND